MKPPDAAPPARPASGVDVDKNSKTALPAVAPERAVGFPVKIAEFLLLFRLRVSRRSALSADMLKRAVNIVVVTCKSWFSKDADRH